MEAMLNPGILSFGHTLLSLICFCVCSIFANTKLQRMPFFTGASGVTIDKSLFAEVAGDFNIINLTAQGFADDIAKLLGKRKERENDLNEDILISALRAVKKFRGSSERNSDGLMVVNRDEVDLREELFIGSTYRIHSAYYGGRAVAIKVFEGPRADKVFQDCAAEAASSKKLFHANVSKIVGISDRSSELSFVVFRGVSERRIQPMIAKALRTDLNKSVHLSMKTVKGLAAGLSYMKFQQMPLRAGTNGMRRWENFDILAGENDEPVILFHLPSCLEVDGSVPQQTFDTKRWGDGVDVLNGLCRKLFSETNSILYDDSPQRNFHAYCSETLPSTS